MMINNVIIINPRWNFMKNKEKKIMSKIKWLNVLTKLKKILKNNILPKSKYLFFYKTSLTFFQFFHSHLYK